MKSSAQRPLLAEPRTTGLVAVRLLSAAGLALSAYLLWGSLGHEHLPGCGFESGCNVVLHSRWASWFGLPVSGFALVIYALVLGGSWMLQNSSEPLARKRIGCVFITAAAALAAAAIWFIGLQLFVVRAICPFCMATHACGLLTSVMLFVHAPRAGSGQRVAHAANGFGTVSSATAARCGVGGLAAVLVLGAGQIIQPIKTYEVQPLAGNALSTTNLMAGRKTSDTFSAGTNSQPSAPSDAVAGKPRRLLQLHGNAFTLDLHEVPLHGLPDAKCIIVHLFDYSCKHCRELHPILSEAVSGLSNQLAVVSLPMPLDGNCNHLIKAPLADHTNACAYARAGLAVWRANPAKLDEFDDWIFSPARPPSPETVRAQAMLLVGTNAFEAALRDPWIDRQLNLSVRLYETNYVRYRKSQLPEMMIGTNIVSGVPPNVAFFYRFLASQFDLQLPAIIE